MDLYANLWGVALAIVVLMLASASTLTKPPSWLAELITPSEWRAIVYKSIAVGGLVSLAVAIASPVKSLHSGFIPLAFGLMAYAAYQASYTDPLYRKADRRPLNGMLFVLLPLSLYSVGVAAADQTLLVTLICYLFVFAALFFVPAVGDSDVRALLLLVAGFVPIFGAVGLGFALGAALGTAIVYAVANSLLRKKTLKGLGKLSLPMVPLILWPSLATGVLLLMRG